MVLAMKISKTFVLGDTNSGRTYSQIKEYERILSEGKTIVTNSNYRENDRQNRKKGNSKKGKNKGMR